MSDTIGEGNKKALLVLDELKKWLKANGNDEVLIYVRMLEKQAGLNDHFGANDPMHDRKIM